MIKYFLEFIATFLLMYVILNHANLKMGEISLAAIPIGLAVIAGVFLCSKAFGHLNPAVSVMFRLKGDITNSELASLILCLIF